MRLINADRLLRKEILPFYYHLPNGDTAIPIIDIEHAPTIDAVEVVRCKDCKHYNPDDHCYLQGAGENDYCSYGERKDGDSE